MKVALVIGALAVAVLAVAFSIVQHADAEAPSVTIGSTSCVRDQQTVLAAQSVPTAELVPCLTADATRWVQESASFTDEGTTLSLRNQTVPDASWELRFTANCLPDDGATVSTDQVNGVGVTTAVVISGPVTAGATEVAQRTWTRFGGGCVATTVTVPGNIDRQLILGETASLVDLLPRSVLAADVLAGTEGQLPL
jgi:hypothetical protein